MKIYDFFKKAYSNGKISHVFLIGNTDYSLIKDDLASVLSDFIFEKNIDINNSPDVYIINNNDDNISKDSIKDLLKNIQISSQLEGKKTYIINNVNKLNDYSYNSLLKTIEEPFENIYGILIAQNIDNVPETIKSRCQKIFISATYEKKNNNIVSQCASKIFTIIEENGYKTLARYPEIYKEIDSRNTAFEVINELCNIYINKLLNIKEKDNFINYKSLKYIDEKLIFLSNLYLNNSINVNKELLIDEITLGIWRLNNGSISSSIIES